MDAVSFLRRVLPGEGKYVIAEPVAYTDKDTGKTRNGWKYRNYDHINQVTSAIEQTDAAGRTVYFAVNSYGDWYEEADRRTGKMRKRLRTQKNVVACRSLYDDIDVGEGKSYATKKDAGAAIRDAAAKLGLPPMIVNSGGGFHLYWPLTEDITPEEWLRLATLKRAVLQHVGLRVDPAVDVDSARVLRPVGSHNRKRDTPHEVKVLFEAGPYTPQQFERAMLKYADQHDIAVLPPAPKNSGEAFGDLGDLAGGVEYPPSSAHEIIKHCATLAHVAMHRGDVLEPLWRGMLGTVKHTVEGEALAHEWSAGYAGYDPAETQDKLDNWATGPALCSTFAMESPHCADCPSRGKVKSPIALGYITATKAPEIVPEIAEEVAEGEAEPESITPTHWPAGFHWDGVKLNKGIRNDDGGIEYVAFANMLFYPVTRVRTEDGTWGLVIRANPGSRNDRTFIIPTKSVAEAQGLSTALASYEVFTVGKNGRGHAQDYLQAFISTYQQHGVETITYPHFGWYDNSESFVLGSVKLAKGGETDALPGVSIGEDLARMSDCKGDLNSWVDMVDLVYNRPGAEAYQLVICAALAAPLVEFTASNMWHGIPIALTGGSGEGKTSAMSVACSLYGPPDKFLINGGENGSTLNAALGLFAAIHNLPIILDEITGRSKEDVRDLLYALSNGRSKIRMTADGRPHPMNKGRWNMLSFISGNEEFSEKLNGLTSNVAEATELRVLDIRIPDGYSRVFADINAKDIVEQQLSQQYGHAGREWLQHLIANRDSVSAMLRREMAKWSPATKDETQERFYHNALIHIVVAGTLAKRLGLVRFDMKNLAKWGKAQIVAMRTGRRQQASVPEDYLAQFLSSITGNTLITKHYRDTRGKGAVKEAPVNELRNGAPVLARQALDDKRFLVSSGAFDRWCRENSVSPKTLITELISSGHIVVRNGEHIRREMLTKGTNVAICQAKVFELDYAMIFRDEAPADSKVFHLPTPSAPLPDLGAADA